MVLFVPGLLFDLHSVRVMKFWLAISIAVVIIDFATAGMEAGVNAGRLYWTTGSLTSWDWTQAILTKSYYIQPAV